MLTIRCAACKRKLFKYQKLGKGQVLRCHKGRISQWLEGVVEGGKLRCLCGEVIGHDKGSRFAMVRRAFTTSGSTVTKL